jgi:phthalate 3,4-dioxygenase subunit beta
MTSREPGYSVLGGSAPAQQRTGRPLPFGDERHLQAHQWLVDEAYLLDSGEYESWLDLLTDDIHYHMPVRVTTALGAGFDTAPGMAHFDEDKYSLSRRVARFMTEHAWTEDLIAESAVLLFRSRGDVNDAALVSAGREDLLRRDGPSWLLARRTITVDESVIRMQNLAVFL